MDDSSIGGVVKQERQSAHHRQQRSRLGGERSAQGAQTVAAMREAGITDADIETIVWSNPVTFFEQSGRLDLGERPIDQTALWKATRCCAAVRNRWSSRYGNCYLCQRVYR